MERNSLLWLVAIGAFAYFYMSLGHLAMLGALVLLVTIHEFGHWAVARSLGFKVETFSIGMGSSPRLYLGKYWGTDFQITPWLIGGYVSLDPTDETFMRSAIWKRFAVMIAGVTMNVLAACAIIFAVFSTYGLKSLDTNQPVIYQLIKGGAAEKSGLKPGDQIVAIDGQNIQNASELRSAVANHKSVPANFTIDRQGQISNLTITPDANGRIGISIGKVVFKQMTAAESLNHSAKVTVDSLYGMGKGIAIMLGLAEAPQAMPAGADDIHGVVAIVQMGSSAFQDGIYSFAWLVAMISLNLAIFNILPIPALDGGHILMLAIEKVRGRPLAPEIQGRITAFFMILLLALFAWGLFNDITKPMKF